MNQIFVTRLSVMPHPNSSALITESIRAISTNDPKEQKTTMMQLQVYGGGNSFTNNQLEKGVKVIVAIKNEY